MEIVLRPVTALVLFAIAILLARVILKAIPAGRTKSLLEREYRILPRTEAERRDWTVVWLFLAAVVLLFAFIDWMTWYYGGKPVFLQFLP